MATPLLSSGAHTRRQEYPVDPVSDPRPIHRPSLLEVMQRTQVAIGLLSCDGDLRYVSDIWRALRTISRLYPDGPDPVCVGILFRVSNGICRGAWLQPRSRSGQDMRGGEALAERAVRFVATHYQDHGLYVGDVAGALSVSRSYLSRTVSDHTGESLLTHLHGIRLARAVVRLASTNDPIKVVAFDVGYRVTGDLDRHCRSWLGASPQQLRQASHRHTACAAYD
jgi:AraC-like DNA-binding protein